METISELNALVGKWRIWNQDTNFENWMRSELQKDILKLFNIPELKGET